MAKILCNEGLLALMVCICWEDKEDPTKILGVEEAFQRLKNNFPKKRIDGRGRGTKLTIENQQELFKMLKDGMKGTEIAEKLGISSTAVSKYKKRGEAI